MKILVILIIFVFALSLFRMILEWSKNNNSSVESVDAVVSEKIGEIYQQQIPMQVTRQEVMVLQCMISPALKSNSA